MAKKPRPKSPSRPRVPLPRQTGGVHPDRSKTQPRKRKHRRPPSEDD
jgi:hypothetical protein